MTPWRRFLRWFFPRRALTPRERVMIERVVANTPWPLRGDLALLGDRLVRVAKVGPARRFGTVVGWDGVGMPVEISALRPLPESAAWNSEEAA